MSEEPFGFEILSVHLHRVEFILQLSLLLSACRVKEQSEKPRITKGLL